MKSILLLLIPLTLIAMSSRTKSEQEQKNQTSPSTQQEEPKKPLLNDGDREMLEEQSEQNFNQTELLQ